MICQTISIPRTKLFFRLNLFSKSKAAHRAVFVFCLCLLMLSVTALQSSAYDFGFSDKKTRPPCLFKVTSAKPFAPLTRAMMLQASDHKKDWTGGDAAFSIELGPKRTLWLYGDSFIGLMQANKRIDSTMVHNALAIEERVSNPPGKFTYFWGSQNKRAGKLSDQGFFQCDDPLDYYWPGHGFTAGGKLYIYMHVVRTDKKLPAPFQFDLRTDHLFTISNPQDSPELWRWETTRVKNSAKRLLFAAACVKDEKFAYIYCTNSGVSFNKFKHPVCLARVPLAQADNIKSGKLEWWCEKWRPTMEFPEMLFEDGASEMSVTKLDGLPGYFAFYFAPDKLEIMMRHAVAPEGPWSERVSVYQVKKQADMFYYSAKAHPQYAKGKGEIVLTYCTNSNRFSRLSDGDIYHPLALKVVIAPTK